MIKMNKLENGGRKGPMAGISWVLLSMSSSSSTSLDLIFSYNQRECLRLSFPHFLSLSLTEMASAAEWANKRMREKMEVQSLTYKDLDGDKILVDSPDSESLLDVLRGCLHCEQMAVSFDCSREPRNFTWERRIFKIEHNPIEDVHFPPSNDFLSTLRQLEKQQLLIKETAERTLAEQRNILKSYEMKDMSKHEKQHTCYSFPVAYLDSPRAGSTMTMEKFEMRMEEDARKECPRPNPVDLFFNDRDLELEMERIQEEFRQAEIGCSLQSQMDDVHADFFFERSSESQEREVCPSAFRYRQPVCKDVPKEPKEKKETVVTVSKEASDERATLCFVRNETHSVVSERLSSTRQTQTEKKGESVETQETQTEKGVQRVGTQETQTEKKAKREVSIGTEQMQTKSCSHSKLHDGKPKGTVTKTIKKSEKSGTSTKTRKLKKLDDSVKVRCITSMSSNEPTPRCGIAKECVTKSVGQFNQCQIFTKSFRIVNLSTKKLEGLKLYKHRCSEGVSEFTIANGPFTVESGDIVKIVIGMSCPAKRTHVSFMSYFLTTATGTIVSPYLHIFAMPNVPGSLVPVHHNHFVEEPHEESHPILTPSSITRKALTAPVKPASLEYQQNLAIEGVKDLVPYRAYAESDVETAIDADEDMSHYKDVDTQEEWEVKTAILADDDVANVADVQQEEWELKTAIDPDEDLSHQNIDCNEDCKTAIEPDEDMSYQKDVDNQEEWEVKTAIGADEDMSHHEDWEVKTAILAEDDVANVADVQQEEWEVKTAIDADEDMSHQKDVDNQEDWEVKTAIAADEDEWKLEIDDWEVSTAIGEGEDDYQDTVEDVDTDETQSSSDNDSFEIAEGEQSSDDDSDFEVITPSDVPAESV